MTITREWLIGWRGKYPSHDTDLEPLRGRLEWNTNDFQILLRWKLRGLWPKRAHRHLQKNDLNFVRETTRRAFRSKDDLASLTLLTALQGVAERVASAALMAQAPDRFTIMDKRTWKSLFKNGHLIEYSDRPWIEYWLPYLEECRRLRETSGLSLRDVDRALWAADGAVSLPR